MKKRKRKSLYSLAGILAFAMLLQSSFLSVKADEKSVQKVPVAPKQSQQSAPTPHNPYAKKRVSDPIFEHMIRMQQEIEREFAQFNSRFFNDPFFHRADSQISFSPLSDLKDTGNSYILEINLPGMRDQNIEIRSESDTILHISAISNGGKDENGSGYIRRERFSHRYERSFTLPNDAELDKLTHSYENGVLRITIPKRS